MAMDIIATLITAWHDKEGKLMNKLCIKKFRGCLGPKVSFALNILLAIVVLVLGNVMLEYSVSFLYQKLDVHLSEIGIGYFLLSTATLGILFVFLYILCNRIWLASLLSSIACGIIAVINYYVLKLHGTPLSFLIIKDFATALNVMDGYSLSMDRCVVIVLRMLFVAITLCVLVGFLAKPTFLSGTKRVACDVVLCLLGCAVFGFGYLGENPIKPAKTITWRWSESYFQYGYIPCTIETFFQMQNVISEPEGYTEDAVDAIEIIDQSKTEASTPDIILILNETFYDLSQITDLETDVPYLGAIQEIENLLTGYAVIPSVGGGTNSSEYELLTSNSLQLMPGITPFHVLDLYNANSIVSHLRALGYNTVGSHGDAPENYSRGVGYDALGFQKTNFIDDFTDTEMYYNRRWISDASLYENLIRWYNAEPEDTPRFQYLLTMQNHGDWEMNDSQYDTVHALNDFGEYDEQVDEFLTCIYLSDRAFKELTDYFSQVNRPVIICMMGDHAPSFASSIVDVKYSGDESALLLRRVPLLIWANFELENQNLGTISANYVVPTLLDLAGVKLSPYYSYMLQMKEDIPILSSYGNYYDVEGNLYTYDADTGTKYEEAVDNYFYLEYNNLNSGRKQELFDPYE